MKQIIRLTTYVHAKRKLEKHTLDICKGEEQ